ncbi:MAG TPA: hypothetical protein DHW42_10695 [Candidatus Marinimicrobia bacterium]|nr:hypothetical protein [Candidatus Neomarinimicrobiota bacterium]
MSTPTPHFQYYLEYFLLFWLKKLLPSISHSSRRCLATVTGNIIYTFFPFRRKIVRSNLRRAFPEKSARWHRQTARKCYINFANVYFDLFPVFLQPEDRFDQMIRVVNQEVVDDALQEKRGVLVVLFHFGNWELLADWFARKNYKIAAVAAHLKNPLAHQLIFDARTHNGLKLFRKSRKNNIEILRYLKKDHILYMIADQDARKNGIWIKFFNQWSSSFRGPVLFARRRECPVILGTCLLGKNGRYTIHFERIPMTVPEQFVEESDVHYLTQAYTNYFERIIRENPEQYYWFHRRWKTNVPEHITERET